jgi:hypothetical protein
MALPCWRTAHHTNPNAERPDRDELSLSQISMALVSSPPPSSELRVGDGIRLLRVAQGGVGTMAKPLADGGEAYASVDELRRVGMAKWCRVASTPAAAQYLTQCS